MNYGEIVENLKFHSGNLSKNDLDQPWLNWDINRVYRKLGAMYDWNGLIVRGEEFTTEDDQSTYYLPFPLVRIVGNRVVYDADSTTTGPCTLVLDNTELAQFWTSAVNQSLVSPRVGLVLGGSGTLKGSLNQNGSVANGATSVTLTSTSPTEVGDWVTFGIDSNANNPGDYGHKVTAIVSSDLTISPAYRGPTLATINSVYVRPANTKRLQFFPGFTEFGKIVRYDWVTQPQRLYIDIDTPEVPELSDAIIFTCLAENFQYHNPADLQGSMMKMAHYQGLAKQALKEARQNAAQGI